MRLALHCGLLFALLNSFSQAPHDHFHPGDSEHSHEHHGDAAVDHGHEEDHSQPVFASLDHDATAKLKDWLAGDGSTPSKQYAEEVSVAHAPALLVLAGSVAIVSRRNHDPPQVHSLPARAPPHSPYL